MKKLLIIPDTQVKPGVAIDHMDWLGKYVCDLRPDIIVHLGDHFDLPSLSSYDKGTASIEGKRVVADIEAGREAMRLFERPIVNDPLSSFAFSIRSVIFESA